MRARLTLTSRYFTPTQSVLDSGNDFAPKLLGTRFARLISLDAKNWKTFLLREEKIDNESPVYHV